jgi:hypothetical protein
LCEAFSISEQPRFHFPDRHAKKKIRMTLVIQPSSDKFWGAGMLVQIREQ